MSKVKEKIDFNVNTIRNIGIIAHIDAGKTTLTERFLYYSGKTHHIGNVDSGDAVMDYLDEEKERGITIVAATATFQWNHSNEQHLIHLIDTPGHMDFTAEVERSLRVVDGAIVIFCGTHGVEAQSEKVWHQSDKYHIPKIAFINKLDRPGASFEQTLDEMKNKFINIKTIPIQIPVYEDTKLKGIIDLINDKVIYYSDENNSICCIEDVPKELKNKASIYKTEMISELAELSPTIEEAYLNDEDISANILTNEIRKYTLSNQLCPVLAGSAKANIGVQQLVDSSIDFLPTPLESFNTTALNTASGKRQTVEVIDNFFSAFVFKVTITESTELLYIKIYSGKLSINDEIKNVRTGKRFKVKRLLRIYSGKVTSMEEAFAGDIIGITGTKNTLTGDSICTPSKSLLFEKIAFPDPMVSIALEPQSSRQKDKLEECLQTIEKEDPTIKYHKNPTTDQLILSGMGELHLEINIHRLEQEFKLKVNYGQPQINYREAYNKEMEITGIFDKILNHNHIYAEVVMKITPVDFDKDFMEVEISPSVKVPGNWCKQAIQSVKDGLSSGGNKGCPVHFVHVKIMSIKGNKEITTPGSITGAVLDGLRQANAEGTSLLEPIMSLDIFTPVESLEIIKKYLRNHRATVEEIHDLPNAKHMSCLVPLAETFKLGKELPQISGGRAAFTMRPHSFEVVPSYIEETVKIY